MIGRRPPVIVGVLTSLWLLSGCGSSGATLTVVGSSLPRTSASAATAAIRPSATAGETTATQIKVYVIGAVARPGVYALPLDSRIEDAITAAGGFLDGADMAKVNLAARLKDEQEIFVPRVGEQASVGSSNNPNAVNVNSASATQLKNSLGITSSLASKIVAYRNKNGPFGSVDDLKKVPVPVADFNRIKDALTVG